MLCTTRQGVLCVHYVTVSQVSFLRIGEPPADEKKRKQGCPYATKVKEPISDATIPLVNGRLGFRLWQGVQIDLVNV